jgi:antitoxin ParD1/3/4
MPSTALKLPATLENFIAAQVNEGAYRSREAAIIAAVASEKRRVEQRAWLRAEVQKGLDSGPAEPLDMEDVIRRGRAQRAARKRRQAQSETKGSKA